MSDRNGLVPDNSKPLNFEAVGYAHTRWLNVFKGDLPWETIHNDPSSWCHVAGNLRLNVGDQMEVEAESARFSVLLEIEAIDRVNMRIGYRILRCYQEEPVPPAELESGGLRVSFVPGGDQWCVVLANPDEGADPIVRRGLRTQRRAADELAKLTGGAKKRKAA